MKKNAGKDKAGNGLIKNLSKRSGLEAKWTRTAVIATVCAVIIFTTIASIVVSMLYFGSVRNRVEEIQNTSVKDYFALYSGSDREFNSAASDFVTSFSNADSVRLTVISASGKPIADTSGIIPENTDSMNDYSNALSSDSGKGEWKGYNENSEHVMCMTYAIKNDNGSVVGYVRYVTSLSKIDWKIAEIVLLITLLVLTVAVLIFSFNKSFIRSMIVPVNELNETAKSIAEGNFDIHIDYKGDDEIGQLYSSIENMSHELSRTDKLKNEFITTVSHELRTPLTAIKGWGETIMDLGVNNPSLIKNGVQVIIKESERLSDLVEELLDFSKFQSNEFTLRTQTIDVLAELDETAFTFKEHALRDSIELTCSIPDVPAIAVADPARIRQVFVNVIGNALKYTGEGGKVEILANIVDGVLIIFVRDDGCGIAKKDLPHVKEKFYKANDTVHGNGIGLAVADEIIKLHGGDLEIKSAEGEGTIVRITIPLADTTAQDRRDENE